MVQAHKNSDHLKFIGSVIINDLHLLRFCFAVANEVKQKPRSLQERPSTDANSVCAGASSRTYSTIFCFVALATASRPRSATASL